MKEKLVIVISTKKKICQAIKHHSVQERTKVYIDASETILKRIKEGDRPLCCNNQLGVKGSEKDHICGSPDKAKMSLLYHSVQN